MTRGRESNQAYLYERVAGEGEHEHTAPDPGVHVARRGTPRQAARLVRTIIGGDDQARTAHPAAADTDRELLPDRVAGLLEQRENAVTKRRTLYRSWYQSVQERAAEQRARSTDRHLSRGRDDGYDLSL